MKIDALALMETTSFCVGVRYKRYSVQQEVAPYILFYWDIFSIKNSLQ
ncbi:hypothetical protein J2W95_000085 [Flavobacterium granuli]|uniref:Uncharacterized protein n=1 Tax=Flavobacterium granuli TaxID=280093 RepID=A0ABU1RYH1_9FLAO|nr:hypothetical protein [Flavobacterium granuli]